MPFLAYLRLQLDATGPSSIDWNAALIVAAALDAHVYHVAVESKGHRPPSSILLAILISL